MPPGISWAHRVQHTAVTSDVVSSQRNPRRLPGSNGFPHVLPQNDLDVSILHPGLASQSYKVLNSQSFRGAISTCLNSYASTQSPQRAVPKCGQNHLLYIKNDAFSDQKHTTTIHNHKFWMGGGCPLCIWMKHVSQSLFSPG